MPEPVWFQAERSMWMDVEKTLSPLTDKLKRVISEAKESYQKLAYS